jgi:exopolysaccharide production protein ExoZ
MSDTSKSLASLQIMRGAAAALVLWHHCLEEAAHVPYAGAPPDWLVRLGASGVDLFFVISGFIMMYTNFAPNKACSTPTRFLWHRFLRIYPLYWLCCGLVLALHTVGFFKAVEVSPDCVANALLLLPLRTRMLVSPAWTLVYEVYFYVLFAVSLHFRRPLQAWVVTSMLIAALYLASAFAPTPQLRSFLGSEIAFEFCLGLTLGYITTARGMSPFRYAWIPALFVALLATILLPADTTAGPATNAQRLVIWGLPAFFGVGAALCWQPTRARAWVRVGVLLGDASYAIYLTHAFVMISYAAALRKLPWLASANQWPVSTAVFVCALGFGVLVHLTIEKPLAGRRSRLPAARERQRHA